MDYTAENYTAGNYTAGFPSFWEGGVPKGQVGGQAVLGRQ